MNTHIKLHIFSLVSFLPSKKDENVNQSSCLLMFYNSETVSNSIIDMPVWNLWISTRIYTWSLCFHRSDRLNQGFTTEKLCWSKIRSEVDFCFLTDANYQLLLSLSRSPFFLIFFVVHPMIRCHRFTSRWHSNRVSHLLSHETILIDVQTSSITFIHLHISIHRCK